MTIMQAVQEVAKQGSPGIWLFLPTGIVSSAGTVIAMKIIDRLSAKKNGNGKGPGKAQVCIDRGVKVAVMEEKLNNQDDDIGEIKKDVKKLLRLLPPEKEWDGR